MQNLKNINTMQKVNTLLGEVLINDARSTHNKLMLHIDFEGAKQVITLYPRNKDLLSKIPTLDTANKRAAYAVKNFMSDLEQQIEDFILED